MALDNKYVVIIVNYYSEKQISFLIDKIADKRIVKIIIVDNGSFGEIEFKNEKVVLIKPDSNLGFAKAVNLGIKRGLKYDPDHFMLVNPDVENVNGLNYLLQDDRFDIKSPVIKSKSRNGKRSFDYGGLVDLRIGRSKHITYPDKKVASSIRKIDYVSGCFMVISKKVIDNIGLFDESFFLYWEDVDYCLRATQNGFRVGVVNNCTVDHDLDSVELRRPKRNRYLLRSNLIFINKHCEWFYKPFAYLYLFILSLKINILTYANCGCSCQKRS